MHAPLPALWVRVFRAAAVGARAVGPAAALTACVVLTYSVTLAFPAVWDDPFLTTQNPFLSSFRDARALVTEDMWVTSKKGEPSGYYRPLGMLSYLGSALAFGASAASFRIGNVVLHAATTMLLHSYLRSSLGPTKSFAALAGAVAFGLAPVATETVVWLSGRFDALGATFVVAALLFLRRAIDAAEHTAGLAATGAGYRWSRRHWYEGLAWTCGALAPFCKEPCLLTPAFLLCASVAHGDFIRPKACAIAVRTLVAAALGAGLYAGARLHILNARPSAPAPPVEVVSLVGAWADQLQHALIGLVGVTRGLDAVRRVPPTSLPLIGLVFGIGTCAVAVCLVHRQRAWSRIALAGLGIAALSTSPYALRAPVLELFGDRYLYIPALGFSMALAGGLAATPFEQETPVPDETGTRSPWPARATTSRTVHAALLSLWGATLAHGTLERCRVWRDEATLFGASVARDPENFYALLMLGLDAAAGGRVAEARALLDRSLAANPLSWRTWNAHCVVAMRAGELTTAEASCLRSLELQPENPGTWTNLAAVSMRRGAFDAVVRAAREGLRLKPKQAGLGALLAGALANLGRVDEALAALAAAERVDAAHPDVARLRAQFEARQIVPPEGEASRTLSSPFE